MIQILKTATILLGMLTVITGVAYPIAVTVVAQIAFPSAANGSLIANVADSSKDIKWAGSELIGQSFSDPKYFWGRPSATAPVAYNAMGGSGSNQAPTNPALVEAVRERVAKLRSGDPENQTPVPVDLVTASASGLDPHISEAGALFQVSRVAKQRMMDEAVLKKIVLSYTERPTLGAIGQTRVNVLKLNLALDAESRK